MSRSAVSDTSVLPKNGRARKSEADLGPLLAALQAAREGDFSVRLPGDQVGMEGKIADAFNDIMIANARMSAELKRVGHMVGKEGKPRQRLQRAIELAHIDAMQRLALRRVEFQRAHALNRHFTALAVLKSTNHPVEERVAFTLP